MLTKYVKILFCVLLFIVTASGQSANETPEEKFHRANKLYIDKDFNGAIKLYYQVLSEGYQSPRAFSSTLPSVMLTSRVGQSWLLNPVL